MKRNILAVIIFTAVIFTGVSFTETTITCAKEDISIYVSGEKVKFPDQKPFIDNNSRTLVPVRFVSESLGARVAWFDSRGNNGQIKIWQGNNEIIFEIGKNSFSNNDKTIKMDTKPQITDKNRTVIPLRTLAEAFGKKVVWQGNTNSIYIGSEKYVKNASAQEKETEVIKTITGYASWYGAKFHGSMTASGEAYDVDKLTAAHPSLPFGTEVKVIFPKTGKSTVAKINDRGPHVPNREIDLSKKAAEVIGLKKYGIGKVVIKVLSLQ